MNTVHELVMSIKFQLIGLTSVAKFSFLRSPPDNVEIRLLATCRRPSSRNNKSIRWFFCDRDHFLSNFNSAIKYKCSLGVSVLIVISNCGTKHDTFVIVRRLTSVPLIKTCPFIEPRNRCDMAANKLVLPAPLWARIATSWPLFTQPLTLTKEFALIFGKTFAKEMIFDYYHYPKSAFLRLVCGILKC